MSQVEALQRENATLRSEVSALKSYIGELKSEFHGLHLVWPKEWRLTRAQEAVAWAIYRAGDAVATKDHIYRTIYPDGEEDRDPKVIDVFVCQLRKKLGPMQITIETVWGRGYRFTPASVAALDARVGKRGQ